MPTPPLTDEQLIETVNKIREHGSVTEAAKAMGIPRETLGSRWRRAKQAAKDGRLGAVDINGVVPAGHFVKGVSTQVRADGEVISQWVKTAIDPQVLKDQVEACVAAIAADLRPLKPPTPTGPKKYSKDHITVFPIGDPHVGLYCWSKEVGHDWDCEIAERAFDRTMSALVRSVQPTETAYLVNLGDFFHANDHHNQTPKSKHALDVDGRFQRVVESGIRIFKRLVEILLTRFKNVVVLSVAGNHDEDIGQILPIILREYYHGHKRVSVEVSPRPHQFIEFGNNLIGVTHGDRCKPSGLPSVMWNVMREASGRCEHKMWLIGHVHHTSRNEPAGVVVESFQILAPADSYAAGVGYRSGRTLHAIQYHRQEGECARAIQVVTV